MSGRAAIPALRSGQRETDAWAQHIKQNIDWMTGQQANAPPLKALLSTATLEQVIEQVNQIQKRLS